MLPWLLFGIAFVLVAFGGLMAALDAAITSLSRGDLERIALSARFGRSIRAISADPGAHLNAINFVRVSVETTAAVLVTLGLANLIPELWQALLLAALVMSAISFVLVGVSPRSVGRARAEALLRVAAPIARFVRVLLGPLAGLLAALGNRVTPGRSRLGAVATERELLSVVDEATERDVLEEEDRQLIHSILEFDDTVARSVMVPRTDMVTVDAEASLVEALELFLSSGHSRIPVVVDDDVDNIDRVLYLRDVARQQAAGALKSKLAGEIARPASLVPESIKLNSLLRLMQAESTHMALIVDEYGGIAGLVTLEDLIEELVGDISDEYDRDAPEVVELPNQNYRVSARLAIDELGDLYGLELDDDDVDTVGGLLTKALGRLPRTGDQAEFAGVRLRADRVQGRRRQLVTVIAEPTDALRELMATRADRESGESE